ncbi:hypothetical protein KQH82_09105 [bacterium]|nr:hypothetical protein [bacterium]
MNTLTSITSRVLFTVAFVVLIVGVVDWIIRLFGWTFSWVPYEPGRMLTFSAALMIFVAVMLLRQIRDSLKGGSKS